MKTKNFVTYPKKGSFQQFCDIFKCYKVKYFIVHAYWRQVSQLQMHDDIFHFETLKNFMKFLKYFKTPFWNISRNV